MESLRYIQVLLPLRLKWEPFYSYPGSVADPPGKGDRVRVDFGGKEYVGVVTKEYSEEDALEKVHQIGPDRIRQIHGLVVGLPRISDEEMDLWRAVASYYLCTVGEVYKAAYPAGKIEEEVVKARVDERLRDRLARKEYQIQRARSEETRLRYMTERDVILSLLDQGLSSELPQTEATGPEIVLSPSQRAAYSEIKDALGKKKPVLLHGVTGSGKTEICLKLARECLQKGRNVLFLVPEIALSRQLEERIRTFFPKELRVFHSAEPQARRIETGSFLRKHPYIVLGTRSSIFLPHRDIGLVIVDEEHDSSYKQDNPSPRYNGRDVAIMLANLSGADVLLGSATPSLESLYNCSVGRYAKVNLKHRYFEAEDSNVEVIDTIAERKKNGMVGHFSRKLIEHIRSTLDKGGQVAILRERRAYSPAIQCQDCGTIIKCGRCDVALSLHKRADGSARLVCHYCGKVYEYKGSCPKCGSTNLQPLGAGTQKIEEEAKEIFPQARIARLDSDNHKDEAGIIKKFSDGETDILIGTRMVAKGFDFSGLSLVAVIQADSLLGIQDFRADERALQLLEQFRGRCGRRTEKGLFVIQTSQPDHPVYKSVRGLTDNLSSTSNFLSERKLFGYPPFTRAVNVLLKDYSAKRVDYMSQCLYEALALSGNNGRFSLAGPFTPPVETVSREHIRIIRILLQKDRYLKANKEAVADCIEAFEKERKYHSHIALDVDPI